MKNILQIFCILGCLSISVQATDPRHPFEATDEHCKHCNYCPETLYREPISVNFVVQGDSLRGESVRVTCSDARSVLLPSSREFCKITWAMMPGANLETLETQKYVDYRKLPNCYYAFKAPKGSINSGLDDTSKLVRTHNFGNSKNLNGVSIKVTNNQDIWEYNDSEWSGSFHYYPWSPGVLSDAGMTKDWKNESSLMFEIEGNIAGVSCAKFRAISTYLRLADSLEVRFDGKFKENSNNLYNKLMVHYSPKRITVGGKLMEVYLLLNEMFQDAKLAQKEIVNHCFAFYCLSNKQKDL